MSVPRKMQEFAALYGCEIVEKLSHDGYKLYAKDKDSNNEEFICRPYVGAFLLGSLQMAIARVA